MNKHNILENNLAVSVTNKICECGNFPWGVKTVRY